MTSIGDHAFSYNQLTSVNLGDSLTSIPRYAFYGNRLTAVTIPSSVVSIDPTAFFMQNTWGRGMGYDVPGVPYIWTDDPATAQQAYNNIWYVQLYTEDPTNPNGLADGIVSEDWWTGDGNANGTSTDSLGGHLINPAKATVNAVGLDGQPIPGYTPIAQTGIAKGLPFGLANNTPLPDFLVSKAGAFAPLNPTAPTPTELTTMNLGFSQYHRLGDTVQVNAPADIPGYTRLSPPTPQTVTLDQPDKPVNFVYAKTITNVDFTTNPGSDTNPTPGSVPGDLPPILANSTFTTDSSKDCHVISQAKLLDLQGFNPTNQSSSQDLTNYTTLGGLDFTIECIVPGQEASVSLTLGQAISQTDLDQNKLRVIKQATDGSTTDITSQVTITNQDTPDGTRTTLSYQLTDGGELDDDQDTNGRIVDPVYVLLAEDYSPREGAEGLAATGSSAVVVAIISAIVIVGGALLAKRGWK